MKDFNSDKRHGMCKVGGTKTWCKNHAKSILPLGTVYAIVGGYNGSIGWYYSPTGDYKHENITSVEVIPKED